MPTKHRPVSTFAVCLAAVALLTGCALAGQSIFPEQLAYVADRIDLTDYISGDPKRVEMNVLFNGLQQNLFVLDEPSVGPRRLLVFDEEFNLRVNTSAAEKGLAGTFGRLMTVDPTFNTVVGNVRVGPNLGFSDIGGGALSSGDDRTGLSNYTTTNWTFDVTTDPTYFLLAVGEYDANWGAPSAGATPLYPRDAGYDGFEIGPAFYFEEDGLILLGIHASPTNEFALVALPESELPGALTFTDSILEDETYLLPLFDGDGIIEDVLPGSFAITAEGLAYYDLEKKRLVFFDTDEDNEKLLHFELGDEDPIFAFAPFARYYYALDPESGSLYKMETWW